MGNESETAMSLEVAQLGQPVLRQIAAEMPVGEIGNPKFQTFLDAMFETLAQAKGAGLAAPQVFASVRVFLAAVLPADGEDEPPDVEAFINPKITPLTAETAHAWEGCLSFPELLVWVPRYRAVRIDYINALGEPAALDLEGFAARVVQHEYDHLEGILTIDRAESTLHIVKASEIDTVRETMKDAEDAG